jgi:alpha-mannosidase
MNPVYTGKDVSFIDTKQAQRHTEALLVDAEIFATIAATRGAAYPHAAIDKAWRQLVYGAHHDAITGSESDHVYLDLLTGWREAYDLAGSVLDRALRHLSARLPGAGDAAQQRIVVFNPSSWPRTGLVRARVEFPAPGIRGVTLRSEATRLPYVLEHPRRHPDGSLAAVDVVFRAPDVPAVGYRTVTLTGTGEPGPIGWAPVTGDRPAIENDTLRLIVDPARGGCVSSVRDKRTGREPLQPGRVGNELLVYDGRRGAGWACSPCSARCSPCWACTGCGRGSDPAARRSRTWPGCWSACGPPRRSRLRCGRSRSGCDRGRLRRST